MNYAKYSCFRPSGTTWFGEVPEHWQIRRLKHVATYRVSNVDKIPADDEAPVRLCNYTDVYNNEYVHPGLDLMRATATLGEIRRFGLRVGDVLITKDSEDWRDIAVPALVIESAADFVCGYHLAMIRSDTTQLHNPFLLRLLQATGVNTQLQISASGVTRYSLPKSAIGQTLVPLPPIDEQRTIVNVLDHEIAELDLFAEKKRCLLQRISEKRHSLITRAVTRGLDSAPSVRDSRIPWLTGIPIHWRTMRGKFLWKETTHPVRDCDEMVTCFRDGQVTLRTNRREEGFTNAVKELGYQGIRAGELVVHSMDAFAGAIGVSDSDGKCTPEYIVCNPKRDDVFNPYFGFLLRIMALNGFILATCSAVRERAPRIHFSHLANMYFPLPPISEQQRIAAYIEMETSKLEQLSSAVYQSLSLLAERRRSLILAAVTGQIDVRNYRLQEATASCQ